MWKGYLDSTDLEYLGGAFRRGREVFVQSLPSAAQAFLCWGLYEGIPGLWLWVLDSPRTLDLMRQDVAALSFGRDTHVHHYPALDVLPGQGLTADSDVIGERLRCLQDLAHNPGPAILLTCVQALMQRTVSPHHLSRYSFTLSISDRQDPEELAQRLQTAGYAFTHEVTARGEAALRGGLLDVWSPTAPWPVRLEFFGDVVDSMRTFDPFEQTSIGKLSEFRCAPAWEDPELSQDETGAVLMDYLPDETKWVWCEPDALAEHAELYEQTLQDPDTLSRHIAYADVQARAAGSSSAGSLTLTSTSASAYPLTIEPGERLPALVGSGMHPDVMEKSRRTFVHELVRKAREGDEVHLFFDTTGAMERFVQLYPREAGEKLIDLHIAPLSEGFSYIPRRLYVVAESDLYGYQKNRLRRTMKEKRRKAEKYSAAHSLASWTDIQPGDLVVHADHGVGKYLGLYEIDFHGRNQEVLAVEYANEARLYVPTSQIHLLSRYIGVGRTRPALHVLGSARWSRQKDAAEEAIQDLAAALLETQAARETLSGHAYPVDTVWQHEFEAAFPFEETADQERAIREVKEDMQSAQPMDRLICGDVGYGKTEVAMRAAFKAVMDGKQVAVLVPTTVLAQQHYYTFSERMSSFPVTVEMLSRFRSRKEQNEVVKGLREGSVDIVIGTHRLVQGDIAFRDLGLVIIDEEQRFGVAHKERLKDIRQLVDVLTMTATPIPRTLYMSLTGAKDMSTIQTPPQERLPIETIVMQNEESQVRQAILHELNRDGQVFYLHNRVKTINKVKETLDELVPEAKIAVAHGQMSERVLASVMRKFVEGKVDVLLCTTIIESGVDIPNVNTILIDRADRFGMADLYQLRGRVGRYKHKAYAYLLLPRHGRLFDSARKRISAIKRYSSLGAGFKLALRDLEIRGAGNLLGAQQSGHIAAVGFDLYCQLLRRTVAQKKGEELPPVIDVELTLDFLDLSSRHADDSNAAAIPYTYIEDENQRIQSYRRLAAATSMDDVQKLEDALRDRFGPLPESVLRLTDCARIRILAAREGIQIVEVREDKLMLTKNNDYLMQNHRFPRLTSSTASNRLKEILKLLPKETDSKHSGKEN